jgi:hypothetical protein
LFNEPAPSMFEICEGIGLNGLIWVRLHETALPRFDRADQGVPRCEGAGVIGKSSSSTRLGSEKI